MNLTKNIVKLPKSQAEVQVSMPWSDLEALWNQTSAKLAAEVEIPGFRKGQAPANMVEPRIAGQVQQEVFKLIMPQALIEALQGTNIVPIDYPQYQVIAFQKGGEFKFSAKVTERPVVTVGNYKILQAQRPSMKPVTDEEVNKIVNDLFARWKARQPQQVVSQPQAAAQTPTVAGSLNFNNSATATQPQPAATAPASVPNEPNDVFAKAVGGNDLTDLKAKIKGDLEAEAKYNNELDYEEAILQEVEKITRVDIPDILIQDELNRMLLSLQRNVSDRGMLMEEYLKTQNKTVEQLKAEWTPQAEKNVRMELGLSEIAKQENVNIADDELQAEVDKIQDGKVKAQFASQEPRMHLRHALRQTKTLNLLKTIVK